MSKTTESAAQESELREAAKRLEKTRVHSEYWAKAADDLGLDGHMRMYVHCAINSWKNAAYAMSDKVVELEGQLAAPQPPITKDAPAPAQDGVQPVATLHDDGYFTWKKMEYRLKYEKPFAGWRMDVFASPPLQPAPPAQPNAVPTDDPIAILDELEKEWAAEDDAAGYDAVPAGEPDRLEVFTAWISPQCARTLQQYGDRGYAYEMTIGCKSDFRTVPVAIAQQKET